MSEETPYLLTPDDVETVNAGLARLRQLLPQIEEARVADVTTLLDQFSQTLDDIAVPVDGLLAVLRGDVPEEIEALQGFLAYYRAMLFQAPADFSNLGGGLEPKTVLEDDDTPVF